MNFIVMIFLQYNYSDLTCIKNEQKVMIKTKLEND